MSLPEPIPCPCCGREARRPSADLLALSLGLTPVQSAILRAVMAGRGEAVQTDRILAAIYANAENPPDANRRYATFKEKLCLMRPKLARLGLTVENVWRGEGYWLVRVDVADRAA